MLFPMTVDEVEAARRRDLHAVVHLLPYADLDGVSLLLRAYVDRYGPDGLPAHLLDSLRSRHGAGIVDALVCRVVPSWVTCDEEEAAAPVGGDHG